MATVTHVTTIDHVAKILGEDQELLEAICELAIIGTAGQLKRKRFETAVGLAG